MAFDTYSGLKTAVQEFMARSDLSGNVADWITLAEARLNRLLGAVEVDQALTGTVDSRRINVSAYAIVAPLALFVQDTASADEREVLKRADGTFEYLATSGAPRVWGMDASMSAIDLDRPCDAAYIFRFRYRQRFALSDAVPSNWLLANYPDLYLAAALVWGGGFVDNLQQAAGYKSILDEGIPEVRHMLSEARRGVLVVDPALVALPRRGTYQGIES